jgi:hypothetical protein
MNLKKMVSDVFLEATEEVMNGETAINLDVSFNREKNTTTVEFDIDRGRGGIDSYTSSYVEFKSGEVRCGLGESLEGCGVEEIVEEKLKPIAHKVIIPMIPVIDFKERLTLHIDAYEFFVFIDKNSKMSYNKAIDFSYKHYLQHEDGGTYVTFNDVIRPNAGMVEDHEFDYMYEFFKAHPKLADYDIMFTN